MAVKCILTGQTPSVLDGVTENVQTQLNDKVDKVTGKGLSTNDYTNAEKTKLSGIETGAQKNTITGVKGNAETTYRTGNVNITATNIGLGNVNNTSDANKPISNATQAALNDKQSKITANGLLTGDGNGGVTAAVKGTDYDTEIGIVHYEDSFDSVEAAYNKSKRLFCSEYPKEGYFSTDSAKLYALLNRSQPYVTGGGVEIKYTFTCLDKTITLTREKQNSTATPVDTWEKGSQAFNPRFHASTHKTGGGDAIAPSDIGAQTKIKANGVLKGDGSGNISAATAADIPGLDGKQAKITGAATTITNDNLTADRALISNSSGKVAVSSVTSTELGYLDGVTSNIQTQLNNKLSSAPVTSVNNKTGAVTLAKGDVGLGNVDNTSDANKPISNATQAALNDKQSKITANGILKGDGTGNITAASETEVELVSLPNICNPNLLDNWYFGNPVDQRNGYIVPPGVEYKDTSTGTTVGTTTSYYPVQRFINQNALISVSGTTYFVQPGGYVRGYYAGTGYMIDRWTNQTPWGNIGLMCELQSDGCKLTGTKLDTYPNSYSRLVQIIDPDICNAIDGKLCTLSLLCSGATAGSTGVLPSLVYSNSDNGGPYQYEINSDFISVTFKFQKAYDRIGVLFTQDCSLKITAAKLELGSQQTLAHQENGVWVLNEIPDYGEQLRRCQRYYFKTASAKNSAYMMRKTDDSYLMGSCTFPVTMRATPSVQLVSYRNPTTGAVITAEGTAAQTTPDGFCIVNDAGKFAGSSVFQVAFSATADL